MRFRPFLTALAAISLSLSTACLGTTEPIVVPTIETTAFDASLGVNLAASTMTPSGLYYRDLTVGAGTTLAPGQTVGVNYTGSLPNATVFDRYPRTAADTLPFTFRLGAAQVIAGWDEGLVGMKVGGRRQLIVPSWLAYGSQKFVDTNGNTVIPSYAILVFTVDAVSAQ
jgi:peptidylprolyl isomerase